MSTDSGVLSCPACGGDRTSIAIDGQLYCVECNRMYAIVESKLSASDSAELAGKDAPHTPIQLKRAA